MFERKLGALISVCVQYSSSLTYSSYVDAGHKVRVALYLRSVQAIQNLADVRSQGREDLRSAAAHAHQAD
jgi:hypothetical protein